MTEPTGKSGEFRPSCPKCGSKQITIERRLNGKCRCRECGREWPNKQFENDAQAALAERDKRINELEDALRRITKCNKEFCDWLGIRNCTDNHGKHECFCIYCEVERANEALEGK